MLLNACGISASDDAVLCLLHFEPYSGVVTRRRVTKCNSFRQVSCMCVLQRMRGAQSSHGGCSCQAAGDAYHLPVKLAQRLHTGSRDPLNHHLLHHTANLSPARQSLFATRLHSFRLTVSTSSAMRQLTGTGPQWLAAARAAGLGGTSVVA